MLFNIINNNLKKISVRWQKFLNTYRKNRYLCVKNLRDDFFGMMAGFIWANSSDRVVIVAEDGVLAKKIAVNLSLWGVEHAVIPCSWNQIDRNQLRQISVYFNRFLRRGGIIVTSAEEWDGNWVYRYHAEIILRRDDRIGFAELSGRLVAAGYTRVRKINGEGEFSVMGDVWMIWPLGSQSQLRLEIDGNVLSKIHQIDRDTGEIKKELDRARVDSWLQRVEETTAVKDIFKKVEIDVWVRYGLSDDSQFKKPDQGKIMDYYFLPTEGRELVWPINEFVWQLAGMEGFANYLQKHEIKNNIVVTANVKEFHRWIYELKLDFKNFQIFEGTLPAGGYIGDDQTVIWTDRELFGVVRKSVVTRADKINFKKLAEFKVGDLVVHSDHGIGLLKDFTTRHIDNVVKDYLVIEYDRGDLLYVPIEQLNKVSKYIGSKLVKLSRLGSMVWEKRKKRVKRQVEEMAKELLRLYARRKLVVRNAYSFPEKAMDKLEKSFDFQLTADQTRALQEIQRDLDMSYPMDRLLCGDVGFGKTELAIRVAGRVANNRRQVAVLVPTTILAEQHYVTFMERLSGLGIKVDVLSRLRDRAYQKRVLSDLKKGNIQVLVGTHRILQRDVEFKKLGLLVIDEEQKFGVRAKERLKKLRNNVDILSMSATPIPRTLNMAMGGVRDLSLLEMAPVGRRAVETEIMPYSDEVIRAAVEKETARGGQVFVIHNRVRTIAALKQHLQDILPPSVKIGVAHGRMSEKELAQVMTGFARGDYDVLVATTIVENGLDLPNVNTLIVENAAGLGLSQLYQLRGRVGRSSTKAYAYFLYRSEKLKLKAKQRLQAITEAKELGSGMKLALADMEIRGAGNILGVQQHGNVYAVGLGMFLDMLNEMVEILKKNGEDKGLTDDQVVIDLPVSFAIPKHYIEDNEERLYWEQRVSAQIRQADLVRIEKEMADQFGMLPEECRNMFKVVKLRLLAQSLGIVHIGLKKSVVMGKSEANLVLRWPQNISIDWVKFLSESSGQWVFRENEAVIDVNRLSFKAWFDWLIAILDDFAAKLICD